MKHDEVIDRKILTFVVLVLCCQMVLPLSMSILEYIKQINMIPDLINEENCFLHVSSTDE